MLPGVGSTALPGAPEEKHVVESKISRVIRAQAGFDFTIFTLIDREDQGKLVL